MIYRDLTTDVRGVAVAKRYSNIELLKDQPMGGVSWLETPLSEQPAAGAASAQRSTQFVKQTPRGAATGATRH